MPGAMVSLLLGSQMMSAVHFFETRIDHDLKSYKQITTQPQREHPDQSTYEWTYAERANRPYLRSGEIGLDALFALAMSEAAENSVSHIRDDAFQNGQALPCKCFETGELWHYVWTRDSAYAVDLGLAWLDPERSRETLLFKLATTRQDSRFGAGLEIVQDTGSGGSWPISSDRVVWGLGADRLLPYLAPQEQHEFLKQAYEALKNTVETDRHVVFDSRQGLYRGEQSFLDWRQQSYPSWTQNDVKAIAQSYALSTNVLHLLALRQASRYAQRLGDTLRHRRYEAWSQDLTQHIRSFFWLTEFGMFSSMSSATDPAFPLAKFDLLGQSLAVLAGLVTPEEGRRLFSQYPLHRAGPPVIHPQLPATPIYHNRAVWPFVTAYAIKAAAQVQHAPFVTESMQSLWKGAEQNASNMENLEFLSGRPFVDDGVLSGPVVNSRRQLWSVAGFISMVIDGIFGLEIKNEELSIQPHLTRVIADRWIPRGRIELRNWQWRDKRLHIEMQWPMMSESGDGFFKVKRLQLNGQTIDNHGLHFSQLASENQLVVALEADIQITKLPLHQPKVGWGPGLNPNEYKLVFAPMEPRLHWVNTTSLRIERREMNPTRWDLYRNGRLFAENLSDEIANVPGDGCYTAIQTYQSGSSLVSHPAPEICGPAWNMEFSSSNGGLQSVDGASIAHDHGRMHFNDWGHPSQVLEIPSFQVPKDGSYRAEISFANAFGPISTGITAAVKWLEVIEMNSNTTQSAAVLMPHQVNWDIWSLSSAVALELKAGLNYSLRLSDGRNMSYFTHFERYTAGRGGADGVVNRANISGLRLRLLE